ncbi:MAG TPA: hypothetical protein VMC79_16820, partial [Rectinemataceae bacterium]|nr:hypothetical protein [Rectinemataceae bacterium]
ETNDCSFTDNSFGEDWADSSVASSSDESYSDEDSGPAHYDHYGSGLSFDYPKDWELQENDASARVGVFSPDGTTIVLFATAYTLPARADPESQGPALFASAAGALKKLLKDEVGVDASLTASQGPFDADGITAQDLSGTATKAQGGKAYLRVRLFISKGAVHAMIGMAKDSSSLDEGSDADSIFSSVQTISDTQ